MGGVCSNCSDAKENGKAGAFQATNSSIDTTNTIDNNNNRKLHHHGDASSKNNGGQIERGGGGDIICSSHNNNNNSNANITREKEEARLQLVVSTAGRDMVSIQSTRGATFYHDQGFAAALSQHLQQTLPATTSRPDLPSFVSSSSSSSATITRNKKKNNNNNTPTNNNLLSVLSQSIPVDNGGLWAMEIVNEATITKEQLFAKCPQIVENLL